MPYDDNQIGFAKENNSTGNVIALVIN